MSNPRQGIPLFRRSLSARPLCNQGTGNEHAVDAARRSELRASDVRRATVTGRRQGRGQGRTCEVGIIRYAGVTSRSRRSIMRARDADLPEAQSFRGRRRVADLRTAYSEINRR